MARGARLDIARNGYGHAPVCLCVAVPAGRFFAGPAVRCQVHFVFLARAGFKTD
jgi:hypothetical protein